MVICPCRPYLISTLECQTMGTSIFERFRAILTERESQLIFSAYQQIFHPTNKYYGLYRNTWWGIPDRYWEGAVKFKVNDNCTIQVSAGTGKIQGNH